MGGRNKRQKSRDKQFPLKRYSAAEREELKKWEQSILSKSSDGESIVESSKESSNKKENISRSSLFRSRMKIEASEKQKEVNASGKSKISEHFKVAKPEENIGKEPGE